MGIRGSVSRNTLADANDRRDWRIYTDFAKVLIHQARGLYAEEDFGVELDNTVYALDSTTIDLCLSLFSWARFQKSKSAIRLHTALDLRGSIPTFIKITDARVYDLCILDELIPEPGSFYIMDRAFLDFFRLYKLERLKAYFVIRSKSNTQFRKLYSRAVDKSKGLRCDQTIKLTGVRTPKHYPKRLRCIRFCDPENNNNLVFLTNNFELPPYTIA
jgi:hypothetical protein